MRRYVDALVDVFEKHKAEYGVQEDQHITIR